MEVRPTKGCDDMAIICKNCSLEQACSTSPISWFFLFVGLIATLSVRLVNFVLSVNPIWAKICWYIGVFGFTFYFLYKFRKNIQMKHALVQTNLIHKLNSGEPLTQEDAKFLQSILCGINSKEESINFFFIFATSVIALAVGIIEDFFLR